MGSGHHHGRRLTGWGGQGSTRAWRTLRAAVLARDGHTCQIKVDGVCVGRSDPMHVHHTRGKTHGDDPAYLVAACAPCNLHVGDPMRAPDPPAAPITKW
jgi:5-methylcytosine-specific restriction endonuclease McrA